MVLFLDLVLLFFLFVFYGLFHSEVAGGWICWWWGGGWMGLLVVGWGGEEDVRKKIKYGVILKKVKK